METIKSKFTAAEIEKKLDTININQYVFDYDNILNDSTNKEIINAGDGLTVDDQFSNITNILSIEEFNNLKPGDNIILQINSANMTIKLFITNILDIDGYKMIFTSKCLIPGITIIAVELINSDNNVYIRFPNSNNCNDFSEIF